MSYKLYKVGKIEDIAIKSREMPDIDKRERQVSKREAIKMLSKDIALMRKRGYTLGQISEILRGEGLDIAERTLRTYLQKKRPANKAAVVNKETALQKTAATRASELGEQDLDDHKFSGDI